ncbi:hypothetical protein BDQ12DRAFT_27542 [Crucibulum laeve]|uniref:Uncharacterized protein n=1 Tax=Crucibulum laeve TaxID=68775 RepID=A0A5C3MGY8_9AGAR|nr:hypothetical protein BDQ12DRAFT_27542 [Crucibulum laeve]
MPIASPLWRILISTIPRLSSSVHAEVAASRRGLLAFLWICISRCFIFIYLYTLRSRSFASFSISVSRSRLLCMHLYLLHRVSLSYSYFRYLAPCYHSIRLRCISISLLVAMNRYIDTYKVTAWLLKLVYCMIMQLCDSLSQ